MGVKKSQTLHCRNAPFGSSIVGHMLYDTVPEVAPVGDLFHRALTAT